MEAVEDDAELLAHVLAILDEEPAVESTKRCGRTDTLRCSSLMVVQPTVESAGSANDSVTATTVTTFKTAMAQTPPNSTSKTVDGQNDEFVPGSTRPSARRTKPKLNYDPNKARNARKWEIAALRRESNELSQELQALQVVTVQGGASAPHLRLVHEPRTTLFADGRGVWEEICRHQLQWRVRAEKENTRLRRALDDQLKVAKELEKVLRKPNKVLDADMRQLPTTKRVYSLPSDSTEDTVKFKYLLTEIDATYREVDSIFQLNGVSFSNRTCHGSNLRDGRRGRYVDRYSSGFLPFSLDETARAVWQFYSTFEKHRGPLYYKTTKTLETVNDTVLEKFALELFANNIRTDFRVWQVLRRYVEADRVTVLWTGIVEPVEFANKPFTSCGFRETGIVACQQADFTVMPLPPVCTHLLRLHRVAPFTTHSADTILTDDDKREIGAVIEFALSLNSITTHLESLENKLMRRLDSQPSTDRGIDLAT